MIAKIFRGFWFFTLVGLLVFFLYDYASMSEELLLSDEATNLTVSRDVFFYCFLALAALTNGSVYLMRSLMKHPSYVSWYTGLVILCNFFFMLTAYFVMLYNSTEKYDFKYMGLALYLVLGAVALWLIVLPVVRSRVKQSDKEKL
ncbi:MAG: hypothetical protein K1X47_17285 [Cyclobacteriaceae bacterium]|nr:hypothetical protein [Cyclobacteriaceae bacterium]